VALIVVLEALDPPNPDAAAQGRRQLICIANTHIHANPELNDVKLWQARPLSPSAPFLHPRTAAWRIPA
jgi:CCR4-NOT transcription complex subunit 6